MSEVSTMGHNVNIMMLGLEQEAAVIKWASVNSNWSACPAELQLDSHRLTDSKHLAAPSTQHQRWEEKSEN